MQVLRILGALKLLLLMWPLGPMLVAAQYVRPETTFLYGVVKERIAARLAKRTGGDA